MLHGFLSQWWKRLERHHLLVLETLNALQEQCMVKYKFSRRGDLAQFFLYKSPI